MLVINETDIGRAVSMHDLIMAIEQAYILYEFEEYQMPSRNHIFDHENTFLLMPCTANHSFGTKIVSVFPNNKKCPVTQGIVVLNDRNNGQMKALLNGTIITGLKTGAVGGAAIKYLSRKNVHTVGLIGTGYQGLYQLVATCAVREIKQIYLYNRTSTKLIAFINTLKNHISTNIEIHIADHTRELVEQSEIIITATSAHEPVLPNDSNIFNGKLIIGIGSFQPHMREFPKNLYINLKNIYIDTLDAKHESGDIVVPLKEKWLDDSQIVSFSKVITKKITPQQNSDCPTVFKSTGMALFDLVCAERIYEKAIQHRIGAFLEL